MTFTSYRYILFCSLPLYESRFINPQFISPNSPRSPHQPFHRGWGMELTSWQKKTLQTAGSKTWLPKGSAACLSLINHSTCRVFALTHAWLLEILCACTPFPLISGHPTHQPMQQVWGGSSLYPLTLWHGGSLPLDSIKTKVIQGHVRYWEVMWPDTAVKWQPDSTVSSTGARHTHGLGNGMNEI